MINKGTKNLLGVRISAVDYDFAVDQIIRCARESRRCTTSALAVHGVMTGALDPSHRYRLNHLDLVTPDGQPVRCAVNLLYGVGLPDKVSGPYLTLKVCAEAALQQLPIYLYGSSPVTVQKLRDRLTERFPGLVIAGATPSRFRNLTEEERTQVIHDVRQSGAKILLVGLGCPRQEVFIYEMGRDLEMPILAIGAAFDYHAGLLRDTPKIIQDLGLQWVHRILQDPRRLWRRYLITNAQFLALLVAQLTRVWRPDTDNIMRPLSDLRCG